MADSGRQLQKEKLRAGMVGPDTKVKEQRRKAPLVPILVILVLLVIAGLFYVRHRTYCAVESRVIWEKELAADTPQTFLGYEPFQGGCIMYSRDGAEFIDGKGVSVWQRSYQMNDPVCSTCGSYAVIADRGGTKLYIFSDTGVTGEVSAVMSIARAVVSGKGLVYAVLDDSDADFIVAYRKDGTAVDLSVKSVVNGDGYPFDIAVSPDGTQLVTSYVSVGDGAVKESVVFRNFGDVGQNADSRRVVGGFMEEFEGHVVTRVTFPTNEYAHAFYDGGAAFFSTKVLTSPELITKVEPEGIILSIAEDDSHTCLIVEEEDGTKKLLIYDARGRQTGSAVIEMNYSGFTVGSECVILYNQRTAAGYSMSGRNVFTIKGEGKISAVCAADRLRDMITAEGAKLRRLRAE